MHGPVWTPTLSSSGRPATACWAARPARRPAAGRVKTAMIASPIALTTAPPGALQAEHALALRGIGERHDGLAARLEDIAYGRVAQGAHAVRARAEPDGQAPLLGRAEELLRHDVRRELRPADAELARLDRADRRTRRERDLDRAVELRPEVDPAGVAVDAGIELPQ